MEAINERFADPTFYPRTPRDEIAPLESEHRELTAKIQQLTAEWEGLEQEL